MSDKKAIKLFEQGKDKKKYDKKQRVDFLREAVELEPEYVEALYMLADEMIKTAKDRGTSYKPAEKYLLKVIEICPDYNPYAYSFLGQISYGSKKFTEAHKYLEKFLMYVDEIKSDKDYDFATRMSADAKAYAAIYEKTVPFEPFCVNDVSTIDDEYLAIISPDNELMFFTRRMYVKTLDELTGTRTVEVFTSSKRGEANFEKGIALPAPFNLGDNYGGATITPDNKHLYVTVCQHNAKNYMNCDIFTSDFINGEWSALRTLGPKVNTEDGWEAQPSISADGKTLYFATYRAESKGMDIYKTEKDINGEWGAAYSLGPKINTDKNEKSPFIHSDSQTLYFSSDGHTGAGGYDIFYVKGDDDTGEWKTPKNIGVPINTEQDEVGFFVSTDGKLGYFASNSFKGICKGKGGGYDVFAFDLYKEARPIEMSLFKGTLKNEKGEVEKGAKIELKNTLTNKVTQLEVDSLDGGFVAMVATELKENTILTAKKEGMAFLSQFIFPKENKIGQTKTLNMEVKAIEVGAAYRLNNINYATNSAQLTPESLFILDEFILFLKENPGIKIAIHGHTDDVGDDASNLALSTDRAFSVLQYLQENKIDKERLSFKGFGKTKPLIPNTSEANRARNRRTEFVILSK